MSAKADAPRLRMDSAVALAKKELRLLCPGKALMRTGFRLLCVASKIASITFIVLAFAAMSFFLTEWLIFSDLVSLQIDQSIRDSVFWFFWEDRQRLYIAIFFVNAVWFYCSTRTTIARSGRTFANTALWATLYFFIPVVNAFAPFLMTRRLWNLSVAPDQKPDAAAPAFFWIWWISWLGALAMDQWLPAYANTQDWNVAYVSIAGYAAIGAVFEVIAALFFLHIQRTVSAALLKT